jgi:fucose 4-O-acetylase-like acetyltransferase
LVQVSLSVLFGEKKTKKTIMNRISWLDDAKSFGIICVVLGHIIGFINEDKAVGTKIIQGIIVSFNMPLFFMLSGYTFKLNRNWKYTCTLNYCLKITKRLLLPSVLCGGILYTVGLTVDILNTFWFLNILWRILVCYALSLFLCKRCISDSKKALWGGKLSSSYYV